MLISERNTKTVEKLVRRAAAVKFGRGKAQPFFEHGHWWVNVEGVEETETYDVVDAQPSIDNTGLDFELI